MRRDAKPPGRAADALGTIVLTSDRGYPWLRSCCWTG